MQVFVKSFANEDGLEEWGIVELQGDLGCNEDDSLAGKFVGDLFYSKDGAPTLIIGHHILLGKAEKLEKPLAVLEKSRSETGNGNNRTEYIVKAIVTRKLCFRDRPKPIVGAAGALKQK